MWWTAGKNGEAGLERYTEHRLNNENVSLTPGPAFRLVRALQHVNARLRELYPNEQDLFDIVLMTNNHTQEGVRFINSVNHYGIASATMFDGNKDMAFCDTQLRVAFVGDAIVFLDEVEHGAEEHAMDRFCQHEALFDNKLLAQIGPGPLKDFLENLGRLQKKFYAKDKRLLCPIRTYLVTARSAASSGARMLKTLRRWGLEVDEALFLAGAPKGPILVKFRPHIFLVDQMFHIEGAQKFRAITAHVRYGQKLIP